MTARIKYYIYTDLIILLFLVFQFLISIFFKGSEFVLYLFKFQFIIYFIFTGFSLKKLNLRSHEPISLFLFLFFLFLGSKIFLELFFNYGSLGEINFFISYNLSIDTQIRVVINLLISLIGIHMGVLFALKKLSFNEDQFSIMSETTNKQYYFIGIILSIITFPIVLKYYYDISIYVKNMGYLSYHSGESAPKGVIVFFAEQLFWLGTAFFLASTPSKRKNIFFIVIVIMPLLYFMILTGKRGIVMTTIAVLFWYWFEVYKVKLNLLLLFSLIVTSIIGLVYIQFMRSGSDFEFESIISLFLMFFDSQASSLNTLSYSIEFINKRELSTYGFSNFFADIFTLFDKFYRRIFGMPELSLVEKMKKFGYSGYIITNNVSKDLLYEGSSTGTSYVAELFLLGREFSQFIGSVLLGYFLIYLNKLKAQRKYLLLILVVLPELIYLPRMSFGSVLVYNFFSLLVLGTYFRLPKRIKKSINVN